MTSKSGIDAEPLQENSDRGGTWCCEFELSGAAGLLSHTGVLPGHSRARVLVRLHGDPLGYLTLPVTTGLVDPDAVRAGAWREFGERLTEHLAAEGIRALAGRPIALSAVGCPALVDDDRLVSVVVCTRERPEILAACLDRLARLTYQHLEILIVDNAPRSAATMDLVQAIALRDSRFRHISEPRPGLSVARNRGLAEAQGVYIAYTDDDVAVDANWVQGLLRGFSQVPNAGCVTGLVCTASITSDAEAYFDARSPSWSVRCEAEIFDLAEHRRDGALYPYSAGIFGTGANFAFDRALLTDLGRFDEALGAGTKTRGGEDLDMFVRVLRAGRAIVYQPAAVVWHHHRADRPELLRQMFGYGTGLSAYLTKCLRRRDTRTDVLRRMPAGARRIAAIRSATSARLGTARAPRGAWSRELIGFAAGPLLYMQAERVARK